MKKPIEAKFTKEPWIADLGDGTYKNPVLHADYSDPDVIRVGEDFYMTASSFGHIPGLPILHSKDLVNWRLINHAIQRMPLEGYDRPQHGNGVWAPSLRYHDSRYWIFYGDPDVGIFMTSAEDPAGEWTELHLVHAGKGLIDTCPFWDDDGRAYLVHAFAKSRSGLKHRLRLCPMSPDGTRLLDEGQIIFHDSQRHPTLEGPKMYKREGYYYVFAPAGGVETGWQAVFRATSPYGPYEERVVLIQGASQVNGPHQGGWVELESGESWFLHFQDKGAYGRIVHMQPVAWVDGWPVMGNAVDGNGVGEPLERYRKPEVGKQYPVEVPAASDDFAAPVLGSQWQWQANPSDEWYSLSQRPSWLRLFAQPRLNREDTLFQAPHLLLQKFPAPSFRACTLLDVSAVSDGVEAGLIVFGYQNAALRVYSSSSVDTRKLQLVHGNEEQETVIWEVPIEADHIVLRADVHHGARCSFGYSLDGEYFEVLNAPLFQATVSKWVGAKIGLYAKEDVIKDQTIKTVKEQPLPGWVDVGWFTISALDIE
jgi:beta-xylosidase